ncbi:TIMELESS-interacting protein isoform X2 [Rhincodon typus]|uniref:TIMELESS-interacting protein isoform X2 n=1 Tax=Rhincodon typus TaxID=259920 RepID=UPI00202F80E9|nr:TIMELESS-interacting protein isoform X2 [Rhincodon typus]
MSDTLQNSLSDIPDYDHSEDEIFPPLPPPSSPGQVADGGASDGDEENRQEGNPSKEPVVLRKGVKGPRLKLDAQRLTSDRGLPALRNLFNNVRFKGKGHETCLKKIRLDIPITHEDFISKEVVENELQIENLETSFSPLPSKSAAEPTPSSSTLSEEQHLRIERNKQLALQRRQAKLEPTNQMSSNDLSDSPFLSQSAELNQAKILRDPTDSFEDLDAEDMEALKKTTKMESFKSVQQPESPTEGGVCLETSEHLSEVTKTIDCAVSIHESETTIEDNFSKPIPEATTDSQNLPMEQLT